MATATTEVDMTWAQVDAMVCATLKHVGYADGDIEAAIMQGHIGPLSRVAPPEPECGHEVWDENATAKVCLCCKRVLPREQSA